MKQELHVIAMPDADVLSRIVESAPPMTGAEYLNVDLLASIRQKLHHHSL